MAELTSKKDWRKRFLATLAKTGNISAACRSAGISRTHAYNTRDEDESFKAQWDRAIDEAIDALESAAFSRAKKNSDVLLIFLLKSHRPEIYRENLKVEHGGTIDINNHYDTASQVFDSLVREGLRRQSEATIPSDPDHRTEG